MSKKNTKHINKFNYMLLPLTVFVFIPIVLRIYPLNTKLTQFQWFPPVYSDIDSTLWGKCVAMYMITAIMSMFLLFASMNGMVSKDKLAFGESKKKLLTKWYFFAVASFLLTFLSTLFSKWREFGFGIGIVDVHENIWTLFCYMFVLIYAYLVINNEADIKMLQWPLLVSELIVIGVGIAQSFGYSIFNIPGFKEIITPSKYRGTFHYTDFVVNTMVDSTLHNSNYVGVYVVLLLPVSIALVFANRNILSKILWSIDSAGLLYLVYKSGNKSSVLAFGFLLMVLTLLVFVKNIKKSPIISAVILLLVLLVSSAAAFMLKDRIKTIISSLTETRLTITLKDLSFDGEGVHIDYMNSIATVGYDVIENEMVFWIKDEAGDFVETFIDENGYTRNSDPEYNWLLLTNYTVSEKANGAEVPYFASIYINGQASWGEIYFIYNSINQKYYYVTKQFRIGSDIVSTPCWIFTKRLDFASYRGALWGKTLPLLPRYFVLGSGADTFPIAYPNNDYIFAWNVGMDSTMVQKPHNWYLQVWVQQGGLSLLCILAVLGIYFIESLKIYIHADDSALSHSAGLGIMLGILGYCTMGITNDSLVVTAPMFWLMLGVGFAVNRIIKNSK